MVTAIGVAICGAAQEMHLNIETFLMHVPRIDYCDAVQLGRPGPKFGERRKPDVVHEALVHMYGDILDFFVHRCELLKSRNYLLASVKSKMHSNIATIVESFVHHIDRLDKCMIVARKRS
ncbi:hypothetical protein CERZMDRAFT_83605 [Cercospora zeae-maydis SCOH1-5]|uniref:Uncharacterized protein n=1 Tax=Cercospora zeae-maydis SCOH1-5 TaxID=717836 RepID=A0A6A6FJ48_9PEZI|nr:hypothetical protein CERZMDRAFT_83605 [Cercospora zeae-maydis SCOH1-5]